MHPIPNGLRYIVISDWTQALQAPQTFQGCLAQMKRAQVIAQGSVKMVEGRKYVLHSAGSP
jgi:hypothetical protein